MKIKFKIIIIILFFPIIFCNNILYNESIREEIKVIDVEKNVFDSFRTYNENIDIKTVKKFIEVCDSFLLLEHIETLTAQICLESGSNHLNKDTGVLYNKEAIGICQITPSTAYLCFKKIIKNHKQIKQLGAEDYKNIITIQNDSIRFESIKKWLTNETNNLIMYGVLIDYGIKKYGSLEKSLLLYSNGDSYLKKIKKNDIKSNKYIRSIDNIKGKLETLSNKKDINKNY